MNPKRLERFRVWDLEADPVHDDCCNHLFYSGEKSDVEFENLIR
jgi:hypothetical protein